MKSDTRKLLSDSFNRGAQTIYEATKSARAMAASMEHDGLLIKAPAIVEYEHGSQMSTYENHLTGYTTTTPRINGVLYPNEELPEVPFDVNSTPLTDEQFESFMRFTDDGYIPVDPTPIHISPEDMEVFLNRLENPRDFTPEVKSRFEKYRDMSKPQ